MKILIIEDDRKISEFLEKGLSEAGYQVETSPDGENGFELAATGAYDLLILDLMLPKLGGLEAMKALRAQGISSKVLILSAMRSVDDRVLGLRAGGDDYLTKPFVFSELLARCEALLRRPQTTGAVSRLAFQDLSIDLMKRQVTRGGQIIELQTKEFLLLEYLVRNAGNVISKTQILEHVWNYDFDPQTNVVDVLVHRLRTKVDRDFPVKLIQTVRGVGYALKPTP